MKFSIDKVPGLRIKPLVIPSKQNIQTENMEIVRQNFDGSITTSSVVQNSLEYEGQM
jgi:hypothetical protein